MKNINKNQNKLLAYAIKNSDIGQFQKIYRNVSERMYDKGVNHIRREVKQSLFKG